jgi:Fe-S oxidoreductase
VLTESGVSFGILGNDEECCGNEVYMLGEMGLFQSLAEKNVRKFKELGVKKIVTLCPHGYNAMKNNYPRLDGGFEIYHYTELLAELVKSKRLKLRHNSIKVTYQDPCFLGRYNNVYDEPRQVLQSIPGLELREMERHKKDAFCCGGGSGNFVMDLLAGDENSPARVRVREAYATGAEALAVACPACMTMLTDAVKAENLETKLAVKDISQLLKESLS